MSYGKNYIFNRPTGTTNFSQSFPRGPVVQGVTKCPKHGNQPAHRETCPLCKKAVLGYCVEGEYCTSEDCRYVY